VPYGVARLIFVVAGLTAIVGFALGRIAVFGIHNDHALIRTALIVAVAALLAVFVTRARMLKADPTPRMFDHARLRHTPVTEAAGIAGLEGTTFGESVPSSSQVKFIGSAPDDFVIHVYIDDLKEGFWLAPEHVELVQKSSPAPVSRAKSSTMSTPPADNGWE